MGEPGSFWRALRELAQNPLAQREWRGLRHQIRDWRLWLGIRIPKDSRGWGMPAVAWFAAAPYIIVGVLRLVNRVAPGTFTYPPAPGIPHIDALALCMAMLTLYVTQIGVALMAPAVTRERESETWEALRSTIASPHDIVLGLLAGRLGPILAVHLLVGLAWVLLRPHYAPLLQRTSPFTLDQAQTALLVGLGALATLALGTLATAVSARSRSTGVAMVISAGLVLLLGGAIVVGVLLSPTNGAPTAALLAAGVTTLGYQVAVAGVRA